MQAATSQNNPRKSLRYSPVQNGADPNESLKRKKKRKKYHSNPFSAVGIRGFTGGSVSEIMYGWVLGVKEHPHVYHNPGFSTNVQHCCQIQYTVALKLHPKVKSSPQNILDGITTGDQKNVSFWFWELLLNFKLNWAWDEVSWANA